MNNVDWLIRVRVIAIIERPPRRKSASSSNAPPKMRLTPRELDHLKLHQVGCLAQKRLARGLRLNHAESTALIASQVMEFVRDGKGLVDVMYLGSQVLGRYLFCSRAMEGS